MFGGAGHNIEADESLFNKRNKEAKEARWVFGVLERESELCHFFLVPNRKTEIL